MESKLFGISFPAFEPAKPVPPKKEKFALLPGDCVYESSESDPELFCALFEILHEKIRNERWSEGKRRATLTFVEMHVEDKLRLTNDSSQQFIVHNTKGKWNANNNIKFVPAVQFFLKGKKLSLSLLYKSNGDTLTEKKLAALLIILINRFLDVGILIDSVHCPFNEKNVDVYSIMGLDFENRKHCLAIGEQNIYFSHNLPRDEMFADIAG